MDRRSPIERRSPIDRRSFVGALAGTTATLCAGGFPLSARAAGGPPADHFFLQVILTGGLDWTYLFDARPLSMLAANKHANYLAEAPTPWQGRNGASCLVTSLTRPLLPFKDRLSIVNGVQMVPAFDGHENNIGWLITGNAFGGEAQLPHLNVGPAPTPLDYIQVGDGTLLTTINNAGNAVPLTAASAAAFAGRLGQLPPLGAATPLGRFLKNRMDVHGRKPGAFGAGARAMAEGVTRMPKLAGALSSIEVDSAEADPIAQQTQLIGEMFRGGVCRSGLLVFDTDLNDEQNLDTHDFESARQLPEVLRKLMDEVAGIFRYLETTPFDATRSLLDVTTVMVTSEFGRTLTQTFAEPGKAGTDHNPLTNTVLLAGRGIQGGLVLGASDLMTPDEKPSGAHLSQDDKLLKPMGRPFDFHAGKVRADKPAGFDGADYLNFASLANTVYELFDAPKERHRAIERNGRPAPVVRNLLRG